MMTRRLLFTAIVADGRTLYNAVATFDDDALVAVAPLEGETHSTIHCNALLFVGDPEAVDIASLPDNITACAEALRAKSSPLGSANSFRVISFRPLHVSRTI